MASRSSRQKNASRVTREHALALLEDGARIENPTDELVAAAESLKAIGLISVHLREYVKCVEPRDRDFPPRNRNCQGNIYLEEGQDEDGDEICCPKCQRAVRPYALEKLRHRCLHTAVSQSGAITWIHDRLEKASASVRDLGDGTFRVDGFGDLGVVVCVVDADGYPDRKFNTRDYASTNPICYITINPRAAEARFLKDEWLCRTSLVDLVSGTVDLQRLLSDLAEAAPPGAISKVDIPVYAKGHVLIQPEEKPNAGRLFCVEVHNNSVLIDGQTVINPQAGPRLKLFRILWKQHLDDLSKGSPADSFTALGMRSLLKLMEDEGHRYTDETSLRKVINNLQSDIETAVKRKLGKPISREDVVQTCRMTSQSDSSGGYRLNPVSVAIRAPQTR